MSNQLLERRQFVVSAVAAKDAQTPDFVADLDAEFERRMDEEAP